MECTGTAMDSRHSQFVGAHIEGETFHTVEFEEPTKTAPVQPHLRDLRGWTLEPLSPHQLELAHTIQIAVLPRTVPTARCSSERTRQFGRWRLLQSRGQPRHRPQVYHPPLRIIVDGDFEDVSGADRDDVHAVAGDFTCGWVGDAMDPQSALRDQLSKPPQGNWSGCKSWRREADSRLLAPIDSPSG
jgi:hypothetical protein